MRYWKGWMYLKDSSIKRLKGESRGGQDERKFNEKKMERLGCAWGKVQWGNGKVELYLKESLVDVPSMY